MNAHIGLPSYLYTLYEKMDQLYKIHKTKISYMFASSSNSLCALAKDDPLRKKGFVSRISSNTSFQSDFYLKFLHIPVGSIQFDEMPMLYFESAISYINEDFKNLLQICFYNFL